MYWHSAGVGWSVPHPVRSPMAATKIDTSIFLMVNPFLLVLTHLNYTAVFVEMQALFLCFLDFVV